MPVWPIGAMEVGIGMNELSMEPMWMSVEPIDALKVLTGKMDDVEVAA